MTEPKAETATELASDELGRRTVASGLVALLARTAHSAMLLGASLVLARLLTPADFGVFAMVAPLGSLGTEVGNQSFQTAVLQRPEANRADINAMFWFAARVNLLIATAVAAAGWGLASFYHEPRVIGVAAAWAAAIYLVTLTALQEAQLKRAMRFTEVSAVQLVSLAISVAVSIAAAARGAGYWALPIQVLVMEACRAIGIHSLSGWWPWRQNGPSPGSLAAMQRSWRALAGLRMATWINEQPDLAAVGRIGGASALGLYGTARRWARYPFDEPFIAISDVAVASLSRLSTEADRFNRFVTHGMSAMLTISLPAIALVGVEAPSVIRVLLGPQWALAVPFMQLLSVAALASALARTSQWICLARARTDRLLRWSLLVQAPVILLAVLLGWNWGPLGVAEAMAAAQVILAVPAIGYNVQGSTIGVGEALRAMGRPLIASLLAAAILIGLGDRLPDSPGGPRLALASVVYLVGYAGAWLAMPGGVTAARETLATLWDLRPAARS